jgi:hypothetical protein
MTLLYRSPNVVIGAHEWYGAVEIHQGRITRAFRWRPNGGPRRKWQGMSKWVGHRPRWREFNTVFGPYKKHMTKAEQSVVENDRKARETARGRETA